jgi:hypothetical protein
MQTSGCLWYIFMVGTIYLIGICVGERVFCCFLSLVVPLIGSLMWRIDSSAIAIDHYGMQMMVFILVRGEVG